ncbi:ABC transporter ATP-binding protein [Corynebacterium otitidis]|uniref:ABC transporter ATP-binding protein n=1 Tax=Corynebacterium otitidis TaxID=29321 RepID=UPI0005703658|nr:ABC transporter ATP-binding protein [Corynebacterium otitidis]
MTAPAPALRLKDFGWKHASRAEPAFDHVDLELARGERLLIVGDSGSGKSTLLAAIAGVAGDASEGSQAGSREVDGIVGLVLQDPESQVVATRVGDDIAFGCENLAVPRDEIWRRVEEAKELVGLSVPLDWPTARLSGGQKQRLALAGVLAMGADVLLLDEPTANLDPEGAALVREAVARVARETGASLIVVEHDARSWLPHVDRVARLSGGSGGLVEIAGSDLPERAAGFAAEPGRAAAEPDVEAAGVVVNGLPARTLSLPWAASTVITGPNGAGKTSVLSALGGLVRPESGAVAVAERVRRGARGAPHEWSSKDIATRIGTVFQEPEHQFVARTVADELEVGPRVMGLDAGERIEELMARLRLGHLAGANPFTLSGGEKRRLSVATALAAAPEVVLLDEPTFGQDDHTFAELARLIRELTDDGVTVCSITHDRAFRAALGDKEVRLEPGS